MIEFQRVGKRYGSVRALDGVSFAVNDGEVFGYIGPNGAGKTTTIKILTGLVRDYTGSVLADGEPIEDARETFHARVGYLPQNAGFQEWRTVRHALETFGRLSRMDAARLDRRIGDVADQLGLTEHLDRRIVHLSGGMQQRLRFAQAILHEPDIIILDEPLSGLDPASRAELKSTIRELSARNHTIMFSSHVLSDVEDLATRIVILDGGRIRAAGTKEELRARYGLGTLIEVRAPGATGALAEATAVTGVERVEPIEDGEDDGVTLHISAGVDGDSAMREILRFVVNRDIAIRSIRYLHPTLEDVYLSLTEASRE
ncbi:MAG: ATP-binding cassette domain-containing protein [bacterium]